MNKYAEVFAKQNPEWVVECLNCKHKNKFKTIDILKSKEGFSFTCSKCGKSNTIENIPAFIKDFEKKMKKAGIEIK